MRAVGTAQRYLAKPCESGALKAAIVQTQMLRHLLSSEQLALLVGGGWLLPSAPTAFLGHIDLFAGPGRIAGRRGAHHRT